jgi:hypothetical protein
MRSDHAQDPVGLDRIGFSLLRLSALLATTRSPPRRRGTSGTNLPGRSELAAASERLGDGNISSMAGDRLRSYQAASAEHRRAEAKGPPRRRRYRGADPG